MIGAVSYDQVSTRRADGSEARCCPSADTASRDTHGSLAARATPMAELAALEADAPAFGGGPQRPHQQIPRQRGLWPADIKSHSTCAAALAALDSYPVDIIDL